MLGVAVLSRAELEQSIEEHKHALLIDPKNKRTYDILSGFAYNDAHVRYKQALAFDPQWSPGHFELGMAVPRRLSGRSDRPLPPGNPTRVRSCPCVRRHWARHYWLKDNFLGPAPRRSAAWNCYPRPIQFAAI